MYRKQKRMAQTKKLSAKQDNNMQSQFVQRISNLPVVNAALDYASVTYENLKESNMLVKYTFLTAEKSVSYVAEQAKPVMLKFEKQIQVVDDLACKGLGTLEEKAPIINRPPEQIIHETKKLCTSTVQSGLDKLYFSTVKTGLDKYEELKSFGAEKVNDVKNFGFRKAADFLHSPYGQLLTTSVDGALTLTENYVDYYLPPIGHEGGEENHIGDHGRQPVMKRVSNLSNKMKQRMYRHAAFQLRAVQKRSQESISKLNYTVDLIQYAKDNLDVTNRRLRETVGTMQLRASCLWEELNKDEPPALLSERKVEQQLLSAARHLTKQLVRTYTTTTTAFQTLPVNIQDKIATAHKYSSDLYNQFIIATYLGDITTTVLDQVRERIRHLEDTASSLMELVHLYTLGWLVPDFNAEEITLVLETDELF